MARTCLDSATSQFYINHKDNGFLDDGPYRAFGQVVEGMSTIDAIAKERTTVRRGMRCARRASHHSFGQTRRGFPEFASDWHPVEPRAGRGLARLRGRSVPLFESGASNQWFERPKKTRSGCPRKSSGPLWSVVTAPCVRGGLLGEVGVPFRTLHWGQRICLLMLGLPRDPDDIAELAVRGGTRKIDAGRTPTAPSPSWSRSDLMPK